MRLPKNSFPFLGFLLLLRISSFSERGAIVIDKKQSAIMENEEKEKRMRKRSR